MHASACCALAGLKRASCDKGMLSPKLPLRFDVASPDTSSSVLCIAFNLAVLKQPFQAAALESFLKILLFLLIPAPAEHDLGSIVLSNQTRSCLLSLFAELSLISQR